MNMNVLLAAADPMDHVLPHPLFNIGPFVFTNHMLMLLIAAAVMIVVFPAIARDYPMVPRGFRNLTEAILEFLRREVVHPALHEHTDRFMPFLWTVFFFILVNNLLGLVPLGPLAVFILGNGHVAGTATAGLSVTAGLAIISYVVMTIAGVLEHYRHQRHHGRDPLTSGVLGAGLYLHHLVPRIPGTAGILLYPFFLVLEVILSFVKPFALAIRLFANMMAGHIVLASLLLLIPMLRGVGDVAIAATTIVGCAALSCLELFVAFLQAYIFTFLTAMFIGAAVSPEH